ncbi:hypothetical protein [Pseudomonas sp. 2FE]|uniref:DUF6933 domain-containing protein n=1 Tax=Pseudomonas sp. 2FE TaxID=2502190 RepID=UPI0010FA35DC|nr:hypothetical protein [Pseudomonas sp. 2FE]
MLIFNCSKDAARLLADPPQQPIARPAADTPVPEDALHWHLSAVAINGIPCVLAMEARSRYCMVFTDVPEGGWRYLFEEFHQRWFNQMIEMALHGGFLSETEIPPMLERLHQAHGEFCFVQRHDNSVNTHLNHALDSFCYWCEDLGDLPFGHGQCSAFDEHVNDTLRKTRVHKDYFVPIEEMSHYWLTTWLGVSDQTARSYIRASYRERMQQRFADAPGLNIPATEATSAAPPPANKTRH